MKKLVLGAAVSVALFGGAAQAAITLDANGVPVINPADTYEIYLSGASAPQPFIEALLTLGTIPSTAKVCDTTKAIYKFTDRTNGSNQTAYYCEMNTANTALGALVSNGVKKNLLFYKRVAGGSGQGVAPIVANTAIDFLRLDTPANCTGLAGAPVIGALNVVPCNYNTANPAETSKVIPDFGISDVDPLQFRGDNKVSNLPEVTEADLANLTVKAAAAQVFGIAVSTNLRNAMQQAQFGATSLNVGKDTVAAMPSLTQEQVSSLLTGRITSWKQIKLSTTKNLFDASTAPYKASSDRVHICRRTSGSGTQAQVGIKFMGYPCSGTTGVGLPVPPSTDIPSPLAETVNQTQVHAMSSAPNVGECLHELGMGTNDQPTNGFNNIYAGTTRWAIGFQGIDNNASKAQEYRYIKINGFEPTLAMVALGKYIDWVELTYQYNNSHAFDANELAIINELITQTGNPVVLAASNTANSTHDWGKSGFLATPQLHNPPATGIVDVTKPVNPYSHGTNLTNTNNCRMPTYYPNAANAAAGIQYK